MKKIYHYTSICNAIKIFKSNGIKLAKGDELNDPFDCDFVIDNSRDSLVDKYIKSYLGYELCKLMLKDLEDKKLSKGAKLFKFELASMVKMKNCYARLNKSFDCNFGFEFLVKKGAKYISDFKKEYEAI